MALYWPEARMAFDFVDEKSVGQRLPSDVLVLRVSKDQIEDEEFLDDVREIVIDRIENNLADLGEGCERGDLGGADEKERVMADAFFSALYDLDGEDERGREDDFCLSDLLGQAGMGHPLGIDEMLGVRDPSVTLIFNNCDGMRVLY